MNTQELLEKALLRATGKYKSLASTDSKWNELLHSANILIDAWASEPGAHWESLYNPNYPLGSISATDTYDIDMSEVRSLSDAEGDFVRVRDKSNPNTFYTFSTVLPSRINSSSGDVCAKVGETLVFSRTFAQTDPEYGGQILAPVYLKPEHLKKASDEVPVDDPNWLVLMVAAEYARGRRTLQNQYPLLLSEAQQAMAGMKDANQPQVVSVLRGSNVRATEW